MFDNPQQEVKKMSQKLRPIKMSDEEFELFYKEIYAEFGPKDVPPVDLSPRVEEPVIEPAEEPVVEEAMVEEPVAEEPVVEEPVEEAIPQEVSEEPATDAQEEAVQEDNAKAAAVICDVQEDEFMDEDAEEVTEPKKKKVSGLVIALCLECLAIAGVLAYWWLNMR